MQRIEKHKLAALYTSHRLALIDAKDLRLSDCDRSNNIRKSINRSGINHESPYVVHFLKKYSETNLRWLDILFKKERDKIKRVISKYNYHPVNVTCCASCHTGTSSTEKDEITMQRNMYDGVYICKYCEENVKNVDELSKKYLFTGKGFYKRNRMYPKGTPLIGFGGRCYIIKHKHGDPDITNNLHHHVSIKDIFYEKVKHAINCEIIQVQNFSMENLLKHLTIEQVATLNKKLETAKEYELQ